MAGKGTTITAAELDIARTHMQAIRAILVEVEKGPEANVDAAGVRMRLHNIANRMRYAERILDGLWEQAGVKVTVA